MIQEKLIDCPRCSSNACAEVSNENIIIKHCFGCGYTSNSTLTGPNIPQIEETLPELYKDLRFIDKDNFYWYPSMVMLEDKSMVFAEGTSTSDWKWSAIKSKEGKVDMSSKIEFEERDYLEALDYIGYFNQR